MAKETCPACSKRIPDKFAVCPECDAALEEGWADQERIKALKKSWPTLLAVVLVVGFGAYWFLRDRPVNVCGNRCDAEATAKSFVRRRLKSPSSASFAWADTKVAMKKCGRWIMASYVDSQNSFGATVRTRFLITLKKKKVGGWRLIDLTFLQ